jgi:hypothetical protein
MSIKVTLLKLVTLINVRRIAKSGLAALIMLALLPMAQAKIAEGTVISAANLDALLSDTFEDKLLKDLLTPVQQQLIREYGITMKLGRSRPIEIDPALKAATEKHAGSVTIDSKTWDVNGFVTGVPFPSISDEDPLAGVKLHYNFMYTPWMGDVGKFDPMVLLSIDAKNGLQKELHATVSKMLLKGRLSEPHELSDDLRQASMMIITYPTDAKGVGILSMMNDDGALPDSYGYIKAVRRVRRLSGGAWKDPLGGTDLLGDEQTGLNADPRWYKDIKVIGKRWILAVAHSTNPGMDKSAKDPDKHYGVKLSTAPHWDFEDTYEPRQVWVVEMTMPDDHLASKKIYYFEAENAYMSLPYLFEAYDRRGQLWRTMDQGLYTYRTSTTDRLVYAPSPVRIIDLQRNHATVAPSSRGHYTADYPASPADYTPGALSRLLQ